MEPIHLLVFVGGLAVGVVAALMFAGPQRIKAIGDPTPPTSTNPATCAAGVVTIPCTDPLTAGGLTFMEYRYKVYTSDPGAPAYPGDANTKPLAMKCPLTVSVGDVATCYVAVWARFCTYSSAMLVRVTCGA